MLRFLTDENFNGDLLRAMLLRKQDLDVIRVQDETIAEADDTEILDWADRNNRIILTHDKRTFPTFAYERLSGGKRFAGVFVVSPKMPMRKAVEELIIACECSEMPEWENIVERFPLSIWRHSTIS